MEQAFFPLIHLIFTSGLFGLAPKPSPTSGELATRYGLPNADLAVHLDYLSIIPGNYQGFKQLAQHPIVAREPELQQAITNGLQELEQALAKARAETGIDFVADPHDVTLFVTAKRSGEPDLLMTARGSFATARDHWRTHPPDLKQGYAAAVLPDGTLLLGPRAMVRDRQKPGWKAARTPTTPLTKLAALIDTKPLYAMTVHAQPLSRLTLAKEFRRPNFFTYMAAQHQFVSLAAYRDLARVAWDVTDKREVANVALAFGGLGELLQAWIIAPRGLAKLALAALEPYRGRHREIDLMLAEKPKLLELLPTLLGEGVPRTEVRVTGNHVELTIESKLPGTLLPMGAALAVLGFGLRART